MTLPQFIFSLLQRDRRLTWQQGTDTLAGILFFIIAITLFPLALGPSPTLLHRIAPGILWVCALLASLFPLEKIFTSDYEDGTLEQLLLLGYSPALIAAVKMLSHWLLTGVPLLIIAVPLGIMLSIDLSALPILLTGLGVGTICLSLLGGTIASLTLGARKSSLLLPLLVLPLAIPVLIFGASALDAAQNHLPYTAQLELLAALLALMLPLCPLAAGAGLAAALE
ncbi:heme exporter protein CcmB [Entomobacter blattae]|uniref:Heme exporter protein B n=1 Tax=Entomobacter blattae TaxID=2762277 RepID=A0A7H1NPK5_9PROT|nr:heme exporter protein CcmB [Entomobacter blattae]QNT77715.1 Heme exporter protein B [Entomobacter blattae]